MSPCKLLVAYRTVAYIQRAARPTLLNYKLNKDRAGNWVPVLLAARSMESVCSRSLAGTAGSNLAGGMDGCVF